MKTAEKLQPARRGAIVVGPTTGARSVGKKLSARTKRPTASGLRAQFCRHFREAAGNRTPNEIAELLGVSSDMARKYLGGDRLPEINVLPRYAKLLGLSHWTQFFDAP